MRSINELNRKRRELGYSYETLADLSGVPVSTVQKVMGGITKSPRLQTLLRLETALFGRPEEMLIDSLSPYDITTDKLTKQVMVKEMPFRYGAENQEADEGKRTYTLEEREKLPDERRTELIDGILYDMAAPTFLHQLVINQICFQLQSCINAHHLDCTVIPAPFDVVLDDGTAVEPDISVLCDKSKINNGKYYGAPKLVIEVLSPSTRKMDFNLKMRKYFQRGVGEYWLVDPDAEKVVVYLIRELDPDAASSDDKNSDSQNSGYYPVTVYGFRSTVPVHSSGGQCSVDFAEIEDAIRSFS